MISIDDTPVGTCSSFVLYMMSVGLCTAIVMVSVTILMVKHSSLFDSPLLGGEMFHDTGYESINIYSHTVVY